MMENVTTWFAVGAAGMTIGTILFVAGALANRDGHWQPYVTLAVISGIAAVAYALLMLKIGWHDVGDRTIFLPRYIDWLLTTPLLLLYLGMIVDADWKTVGKIVGSNTVMIAAGFAAALLTGAGRFVLFGFGAIAFLVLVYQLVGPLTQQARSHQSESLFQSLRNLTVILWAIYPVIWLLGPSGLDLLTLLIDGMLVTYLDLLTKVGFGLIALNASTLLDEELGETPEAVPSTD